MNSPKHFQVPADLLRKLRGHSQADRLLHRLHSVALVANGFSASEVARLYGDSPRAVAYWVMRYKTKGLDGLLEESRQGRPSRLNDTQMKKLKIFIQQAREKSEKMNATVVGKYIKTSYGIEFTARQCGRILKRLTA